jgi:RNA polymerase sigma factor (sigma-70 family)
VGHFAMRGRVIVTPREEFDTWLAGMPTFGETQALAAADPAYNRGARKLRAEVALDDVAEPIIVENAATSKRAGLDMALNKLAKKDRNLLSMKFGMGLSSDEIAEQVKMSPTQVRKRISRAIERLRRQPAIQDILSS